MIHQNLAQKYITETRHVIGRNQTAPPWAQSKIFFRMDRNDERH